jgi:uncharacterized Fe-S cluster-containing radical SAM superfamily protein
MSDIDPIRLGAGIVKRITGYSASFTNEPIIPIYNVRPYKNSNQWGDTIMYEVVGCNEDCAHCYVHPNLLIANTNSDTFKKKISNLPKSLQAFPQTSEALNNYFSKRKEAVIEFTGGEPTPFRGGLIKLAELVQDATIAINTNGLLISEYDDYLEPFKNFNNFEFLISIKGTTPEDFRRFTGVKSDYWESPFKAYEKLIDAGFKTHLGITLDTIGFKEEENSLYEMIERLEKINPNAIKDITWDKIIDQMWGHKFVGTHKKMVERGYWTISDQGKVIRHTNIKKTKEFVESL